MALLSALRPTPLPEPLPPGRVLLADDDEDMRVLLAVQLRKAKYKVTEFHDGEGLLDYVGTLLVRDPGGIQRNDIVLLDVKMPGFNGLQILASLRLAGWRNPIVLMTALRHGVETNATKLGATALFHKPFDTQQVLELLARVRRHSTKPRPPAATLELSGTLRHFCM